MDSLWKLRGSYSSFLRVQEEGVKSLQEEEAAVEAAELWELQRASGALVSAASRAVQWRICPRSSLPSLAPAALTGLAPAWHLWGCPAGPLTLKVLPSKTDGSWCSTTRHTLDREPACGDAGLRCSGHSRCSVGPLQARRGGSVLPSLLYTREGGRSPRVSHSPQDSRLRGHGAETEAKGLAGSPFCGLCAAHVLLARALSGREEEITRLRAFSSLRLGCPHGTCFCHSPFKCPFRESQGDLWHIYIYGRKPSRLMEAPFIPPVPTPWCRLMEEL